MLPANSRLKNAKEIQGLFQGARSVSFGGMRLIFKKIQGAEKKIAFSVGIKFSKKSTERNRLKRWMREATRTKLPSIKEGFHIMFVVSSKKEINPDLDYREVQRIVNLLLIKAKLT